MSSGVGKSERIMSIDVLRGFDMLLIIVADRFFRNLHKAADTEITGFLATQFSHPKWFGFHFYDIIMPLFLFVVGAVIPFSMGKRLRTTDQVADIYPHLIRRFVILFILGWIVQGKLLELDINQFRIFSNTLQAIAVGYIFSVIAFIYLSKKARYWLFAACLIVYALLLTVPYVPGEGRSVLLPDKNFAIYVDRLIMGRFDDGTQYSWLLTGFGFTATTLSGLFAGEILKSASDKKSKLKNLLILGAAGIVLGLIWNIWHPIVKKIWSSSFVLFSSGISFLLLALFFYIVDIKKWQNWSFFLRVIGMNAITAYVLSHVISFPGIAHQVLFGFEQYLGEYYAVLTTLGGFGILYALLWYMYRNNTYIKI